MKKIGVLFLILIFITGCSNPRVDHTELVFERIPIQYVNNKDSLKFQVENDVLFAKVTISGPGMIKIDEQDVEVSMDMSNCKASDTVCEGVLNYKLLNDMTCEDCKVEVSPTSVKLLVE
ncbi:hypothetical protein [Anaerorhabdus sp.]|uniref:hypothetical protein n=1 Tax=Anaerorhabdus sp. TaxID=1872524 RepID=UPI002FC5C614